MRRIALLFLPMLFTHLSYAQETVVENHALGGGIVETYHVLKSDERVKQGLYLVATRKNIAIATGGYTQGKRTGRWNFYDRAGKVDEVFNYTTNRLTYEAPPDSLANYIGYSFDQKTTQNDTLTKPIKIGGVYFGYMPYVKLFKIDASLNYPLSALNAFLQMLVSPNGNLAECKLVLKLKEINTPVDGYVLDRELLDDYDKQFLPATINRQPVTATISVLVKINGNFTISLF